MKNLNRSTIPTWEGEKLQFFEHDLLIAVGITNPRSKLRVSVLLNTIPEYHVRYMVSENEIIDAIEESDLVIGTGVTAREGILHRKPVIVVGDYGCGGLVTPDTLHSQYDNSFKGRVNGMKGEYFSLEKLAEEIKKSTDLTFQELQMMSNQVITILHDIDI